VKSYETQGEMMISTPTKSVGLGRKALVLLAGLALACVGMVSLAQGQARASTPFEMDFTDGRVNLGFAFKNAEILPGKGSIPGTVSNPSFNPATGLINNPDAAQPGQPAKIANPDNLTTQVSTTGTPLFDYDALDPSTFSTPGVNGGLPASFTPLGCATPVTFGLYAAMKVNADGTPGTGLGNLILNPINQSATQPGFVLNPLANAGNTPAYYRVLNKGAVVASTLANGAQAAGDTLTVASTSGFANSGTIDVGGDEATYSGRTATTFTGVTGLDGPVADKAVVGRVATFTNPFGGPNKIVGPYPEDTTLWEPYALNITTLNPADPTGDPIAPYTAPLGQNPTDLTAGKKIPFTGATGLNPVENNTVAGGFCPNPQNGKVNGTVDAEGKVEIAADDFKMPIMIVPNPLDGSPVPITIESETVTTTNPDSNPPATNTERLPIAGQYDKETGELTLTGPLSVRVLTGLATNPLGSFCSVGLPNRQADGTGSGPLSLGTGVSFPLNTGFNGTEFTGAAGLEGPGAVTGTWNVTADSVSVGGANCDTVNSVSKGLGGIWLGAGVNQPAPFPTCADEGKVGTWPDCAARKARLANLKVTGPRKAKRGKRVTLKVVIRNTGDAAATGVRFSASGRGVRASSSVGRIAAGKSRTERVRFRAKKVGKVKVTFRVGSTNAGKKQASRTIRITR